METNKLTIDEQFLTLEQAKELQKLGIDFSGAIYCFGKRIKDGRDNKMLRQKSFLCPSGNHGVRSVLLEQYEFITTLSVAEMIEMLPDNTEIESVNGYLIYNERLKINGGIYKPLLRDALFEMIKWIKQNKLI